MAKFLIRRLLWTLPVMLAISVLMFWMIHMLPGSPWQTGSNRAMSNFPIDDTTIQYLNRRFHFDKPLYQQFFIYYIGYKDDSGKFICGAICGNLGPSTRQKGRMVQEMLFQPPEGEGFWQTRFGYTARLTLAAFALTLLLGIPMGIGAAVRQGGRFDRFVNGFALIGNALPNFIIGLGLILIFGSWLHLVRIATTRWDTLSPWILPVVVLAIGPAASTARLTRSAILDVIRQEYVRTARAKGLRESVIVMRHILRNALIPIVTFLGPTLAELVVGSFIIESMFSFPGFGREFWESINRLDYSMMMGATLIYAVLIAFSNLIVDMLYGVLDPRVRVE